MKGGGSKRHSGVSIQITSGDIEPAIELDTQVDTFDYSTGDEIQMNQSGVKNKRETNSVAG